MWRVLETKTASKVLDRAPLDVRQKWTLWLAIVRQSGPVGLHAISGFRDEALTGQWAGFRASRLSLGTRVIYRVHRDVLEVHVVKVTAQHDYRRR
ncbi:MAG TPA: hypothetical protein VGG39_19325 [Polyangiaceae bacterium]|jgi:mRNA-degrading endonuclease YafQ of YafQ-DinJ toxin-antitoxin module